MTLEEQTIYKIRQLPDNLIKQVHDFVDYLIIEENHDDELVNLWEQFSTPSDNIEIEISDFFLTDEQ
ncbi:conserved hypothetical protein [Gloeothece citriformis PCC 7424]|uniref:DUF2281 domain-containing protein n=1 Tax=Gloeothece citriformis (strain PCC 7424) TaxID=65393 RepID=B7K9Q9_GLOC7|nr:hypothetical protein [Gloeothece citriformis]ACK70027.1 conserved hypothetical protein [Gloeothece citriformis PCC 7424]